MAGYSLQPCSVDLTDSGILLFLEISCLCDVVEKNKEQQQRDPRKEKTHIYTGMCVFLSRATATVAHVAQATALSGY